MEFAKKLKFLRKMRNFSQRSVAAEICVSTAAYSKFETGKIFPAEETLKFITRILCENDQEFEKEFEELKRLILADKKKLAAKKNRKRVDDWLKQEYNDSNGFRKHVFAINNPMFFKFIEDAPLGKPIFPVDNSIPIDMKDRKFGNYEPLKYIPSKKIEGYLLSSRELAYKTQLTDL